VNTITNFQKDRIGSFFLELTRSATHGRFEYGCLVFSYDDGLRPLKQLIDALRGVPLSLVASMERAEELADLSDHSLTTWLFTLVKELGPVVVSDVLQHHYDCLLNGKSVYDFPCEVVNAGPPGWAAYS
jgi:hypothetical protein